jgi:hypothetical protein
VNVPFEALRSVTQQTSGMHAGSVAFAEVVSEAGSRPDGTGRPHQLARREE